MDTSWTQGRLPWTWRFAGLGGRSGRRRSHARVLCLAPIAILALVISGSPAWSQSVVTVHFPANLLDVSGYPVVGTPWTAAVAVSDQNNPDEVSCAFDWGDGSTTEVLALETSPANFFCEASHSYSAAGTYTLEVTATDSLGDAGSNSIEVPVLPSGSDARLLVMATDSLARGNLRAGCSQLQAFARMIEGKSGSRLDPAEAAQLIGYVASLRAAHGC